MSINLSQLKKSKKGFTLIELLVVISIIGFMATLAIVSLNNARMKAKDTRRIADMKQIKQAFELFYDDHARYPDNSNDGISNSGEVIGDNDGPIEIALKSYMSIISGDPSYNGSTGLDDYFYSYDPSHCGCDPVISINKFETQAAVDQFGRQDTSCGGDMHIDTSHYNYCFIE